MECPARVRRCHLVVPQVLTECSLWDRNDSRFYKQSKGKRRRELQRMRWLDRITDSRDMNLSKSRAEEIGMGLQRVRHNNWTTTNSRNIIKLFPISWHVVKYYMPPEKAMLSTRKYGPHICSLCVIQSSSTKHSEALNHIMITFSHLHFLEPVFKTITKMSLPSAGYTSGELNIHI